MRVNLTWTAGVDLDLYLAPSSCQALYPQAACGIIAKSDASAGTSEVVTRAVTAGESFAIFVDNLSQTSTAGYSVDVRIQ
jgi:hypothetical protein